MSETISVRYNSSPIITRVLRDFRNEVDPEAVVDITGYGFRFVVKRDLEDTDAEAWFDLAGSIVTAAEGIYRFTLTPVHTCQCPGTWPGEIRWWSGGYVAGTSPTDSVLIDYEVLESVTLV